MTRLAPLLLLLAGCSGSDPWPGRYVGSTVTEERDCDTGEVFEPIAQDSTVRLERGDRGLFVAGRCPVFLDELSDSVVDVVPLDCDYALDDGTPISVRIVSGRGVLDGDELTLELSGQAETPSACVTSRSTFVGVRN